ncbi:hypothetical protein JXX30_00265 [Rhodococcus erythropolis]|uniref:GDSL-type esterase/lipase family protein n=1 Tax=Rhodococcus erythropolis TaxID=1833 RepID=UPI00197F46DB|nr:GDSL-type esterase/lipase family protein [Rhodococcus erythropolis]QSE41310.1 hypothetical protein JXX30_00265 [Rhodococcus erythropolis]
METHANELHSGHWVASWAGPIARHPAPQPITGRTLRLRATSSIAGHAIRIVVSNEYGTTPLRIGAASVAAADTENTRPRPLQFAGEPGIDIAVGATALSTEVPVDVAAGQTLYVNLFLPHETLPASAVLLQAGLPPTHPLYVAQPDYPRVELSGEGDFTDTTEFPDPTQLDHLPFLSRIDVSAADGTGAIAVLGTTYTDGLEVWPDHLSRRLNSGDGRDQRSVVNLSARGGSLSRGHKPSGREGVVTLFDREVLTLPGLTHVVVSEARQDITTAGTLSLRADGSVDSESGDESGELPVDAASLTAAYRQLIAKAHARGVKVLGATMPPFRGVPAPGYYSDAKDELRETMNRWIAESGEFDAVIDIDGLVRDPEDPRQYREEYRSPNMYGPNPAGHAAIADAIDPALFR